MVLAYGVVVLCVVTVVELENAEVVLFTVFVVEIDTVLALLVEQGMVDVAFLVLVVTRVALICFVVEVVGLVVVVCFAVDAGFVKVDAIVVVIAFVVDATGLMVVLIAFDVLTNFVVVEALVAVLTYLVVVLKAFVVDFAAVCTGLANMLNTIKIIMLNCIFYSSYLSSYVKFSTTFIGLLCNSPYNIRVHRAKFRIQESHFMEKFIQTLNSYQIQANDQMKRGLDYQRHGIPN